MSDDDQYKFIHSFETDHAKCGFCNFRVFTHYLIAETREQARALGEDFVEDQNAELVGFCGDCLVREIINGEHRGKPKMAIVERDVDEIDDGARTG